jgi:hypothetical protein
MVQTYNLQQGFPRYGMNGKHAAFNEMKQLHERGGFVPMWHHYQIQKKTNLWKV